MCLVPKCRSTVTGRLRISELVEELKTKKEIPRPQPLEIVIQHMWGEIQELAFLKSSPGFLIHSLTAGVGTRVPNV